ncbi:MAG: 50S ribosomal protein L29 [Gemmatimonadales bacterium]
MSLKDAEQKPLEAAALREMGEQELAEGLLALREAQFRLRFRAATGDLENPMQFRMMRRNIARIETVLRERRPG